MGASSGEKESQSFPGLKQQGQDRSSGRDELSTARSFCFGCWSASAAKAPGTSDMVLRLRRFAAVRLLRLRFLCSTVRRQRGEEHGLFARLAGTPMASAARESLYLLRASGL